MELTLGSLAEVDPTSWDALVPGGYPFLRHGFLETLDGQGCTTAETGWQPLHLRWHDEDALVGAAPLYVKGHSHGEFVYDWYWASAAERAGQAYYPKLFLGPPFTPATGPRLLGSHAQALPEIITGLARHNGFGSVHASCVNETDAESFTQAGFVERRLWQYHWQNRGFRDFDDFLDALKRRKRKNIRQERCKALESGWTFERHRGDRLPAETWRTLHRFHQLTFEDKGNWTTLTESAFERWREHLGARTLVVLARNPAGHLAAGALFFASDDVLYGRYWGTEDPTPFVHFEVCYYQAIEYAIEHGYERIEPGAQGTHKIARGFDPAEVRNFHWFADEELARAITRHLAIERERHLDEGDALQRMSAYGEIDGCR